MSSIMSMSSMVSSSLLMKVELLEPVSIALSSEVCELEEGKNRKGYNHVQTNQTMVVFLGYPPKAKEVFLQDPWHSNSGYPVRQDSATKPNSYSSLVTLQGATWKTKIHRSSPYFSFPSLLPNLSLKLLISCNHSYFPYSIQPVKVRGNPRARMLWVQQSGITMEVQPSPQAQGGLGRGVGERKVRLNFAPLNSYTEFETTL